MPPARRSTGTRSTSGPGRQSTLSFGHRVTKNVSKASKDSAISPSVAKQALSQKKEQGQTVPGEDAEGDDVKHDVAQDVSVEPEELQPEEELKPVPEKSEFEVKAEKISNAAVQRYWRSIESQRMAEQVHQEGVTTAEKVLRYFDVSSQYGPCIGIARMKRWQRAQRLGLNPPIEVLAVLIKEEARGNEGVEKAHMDELMNPTAVEP